MILKTEGLAAFFVGMSSPLAGSALSEALQFSVLRKLKELLSSARGLESSE